MRRDVRLRVEMGERALQFSRAHPSTEASHVKLLARLEELITRAQELGLKEDAGRKAETSAVSDRAKLRGEMQFGPLRHLIRIGQLAAQKEPGLAGRFRVRGPNGTYKATVISTQNMVADGRANQDLFLSLGLADGVLDQLTTQLGRLESLALQKHEGRTTHIGARNDLEGIATEIVAEVERLNSFNRMRFREDRDMSAGWDAARSVIGTKRSKVPEVTPPLGEVAPGT